MLLSGEHGMSFILQLILRFGKQVVLQPRKTERKLNDRDPSAGDHMGPPRTWKSSEVQAATEWFATLRTSAGTDDEEFVWFGGGIGFARTPPVNGSDIALDVVILERPDAPRPTIDDVQSGRRDVPYITVDLQFTEIDEAVLSFQSLLRTEES